jgi:hypothetical protein
VGELLAQAGVQGVAQAVTQEVEADHHDHDGQAGDCGHAVPSREKPGANPFCLLGSFLQRQEVDEVSKVFWFRSFGYKLQIADALANRNPQRMGIDDASETLTRTLSLCRFNQEIIVKGENHSTELIGPVQKF